MKKQQDGFTKLYIDQLKDLYSAEKQLVKALPRMAKAASADSLKEAFTNHLEETNEQMERLKEIFSAMGEKPDGKKCAAMEGLIKEGKEMMEEEDFSPEVLDAALIAAAQRIEHYEISAYGTAKCFSKLLGFDKAYNLLDKTSKEEMAADDKLNDLANDEINQKAIESSNRDADDRDNEEFSSNKRRKGSEGRGIHKIEHRT